MFDKILIANRGEIALRVIRACKELCVATVAVHSTADSESWPVAAADEAVLLGPGPSKRSYLNMAAVLEAARQTGAQAIHPGYGFLSEDPDFAEVCESEGFTFIGPPADVMGRLSDKATTRALMSAAGLPLLPGSLEPLDDVEEARKLAQDIGFPVIIKAVAGGGGRGMHVVEDERSFNRTYLQTRAEAQAIFGDSRVYVERYLVGAHHVEVQVLCDRYGNAVHLGERDCSAQRRHQKLVEESPAPGIDQDLRERVTQAAVHGALSAGYVGAGTFEFLVDDDGGFYLMEVNCRIQVEHPVTEMVSGIDLVQAQIRVAAGETLGITQADVVMRGASIECRINVEDPDMAFAPTPGVLERFAPPAGPFIRVDTHGYPGYRVPANYDSLLAKLVVWGANRDEALMRMGRALDELTVEGPGVATTRDFLHQLIDTPQFQSGRYSTALVDELLEACRCAA